jgi:hypothetical protein
VRLADVPLVGWCAIGLLVRHWPVGWCAMASDQKRGIHLVCKFTAEIRNLGDCVAFFVT